MAVGPGAAGRRHRPALLARLRQRDLREHHPGARAAAAADLTEIGVIGVLHLAVVIRIVRARGAAARQRAVELETFRAIHSQIPNPSFKTQTPICNRSRATIGIWGLDLGIWDF